jgi:hypothetical protein
MSAAMMRRFGPLALVALQGWGCGETRLLDGFSEGQTRLRLAPSEFVGSVPCQKGTSGALQSYVVRLQELDRPFELDGGLTTAFTSGPVPCDQAVLFPTSATRFYGAEIRGFDRAVNETDVETVAARWTATCGRGRPTVGDAGLDPYRPTLSLRGVTVAMRGCTSFDGPPAGSADQLVVDQASALGERRCGQAAGEVASFQATLAGVTRIALCGDPLVFDVAGPERYHTIQLTGFGLDGIGGPSLDAGTPAPLPPTNVPPELPDASTDAGEALDASASVPTAPEAPTDAGSSALTAPVGVARWRTECVGRSLPGVAASAYCDPLAPLP